MNRPAATPSNVLEGISGDAKHIQYTLIALCLVVSFLVWKWSAFLGIILLATFICVLILAIVRRENSSRHSGKIGQSLSPSDISINGNFTRFSEGNGTYFITRVQPNSRGIRPHGEIESLARGIASFLNSITAPSSFILTAVPAGDRDISHRLPVERFLLQNSVYFRTYLIQKGNGAQDDFAAVTDALRSAGLNPNPVDGKELAWLLGASESVEPGTDKLHKIEGRHSRFERMGSVYGTSHAFLDLKGVDRTVWAYLISLNMPFRIKIGLEKLDDDSIGKTLRRSIAEYGARIRIYHNMEGKKVPLVEKRREAEMLLGALNCGIPIFGIDVALECYSPHPARLKMLDSTLLRNLASLGINHRQIARNSRNGCGIRLGKPGNYPLDANTIANMIFFPEGFEEMDGVLIGVDLSLSKPFFMDVFAGESYNMTVLGQTGSGKSFFIKLILRRMLQLQMIEEILIFDPLGEYGERIFGSPDSKGNFAISVVDLSTAWDEAIISRGKESGGTTGYAQLEQLGTIPRHIRIIRNLKGIDAETALAKSRQSIDSWVTGRPEMRKILLIDEAHVMLRSSTGREIIDNLMRHSRHYNTSVIVTSQNLEDFMKGSTNRSILSNSRHVFVFRSSESGKNSIHNLLGGDYDIPDVSMLPGGKNSPFSECIYSGDGVRRLRVIASKEEAEAIG
ncbi:MAG: ATP-binding protein [Candidatus Thermoplasmatota archaeon]|nr:ATP-binding protein [Candidatus Thermoplasmatota archaeon]MCL5800088.1 ATP-binding protein [Candidatus Thermoplasmatota archaeon]